LPQIKNNRELIVKFYVSKIRENGLLNRRTLCVGIKLHFFTVKSFHLKKLLFVIIYNILKVL